MQELVQIIIDLHAFIMFFNSIKKEIDDYEQEFQQFLSSGTVSEFMQLLPDDTAVDMSSEKVHVQLKFENTWSDYTLADLFKFITVHLGIADTDFDLSYLAKGSIAVNLLCSPDKAEDVKHAICSASDSLHAKGVLQASVANQLLIQKPNGKL